MGMLKKLRDKIDPPAKRKARMDQFRADMAKVKWNNTGTPRLDKAARKFSRAMTTAVATLDPPKNVREVDDLGRPV